MMLNGSDEGTNDIPLFVVSKQNFPIKMFRLYLGSGKHCPTMDEDTQGRGKNQYNHYFLFLAFQIRASNGAFCGLRRRTTTLDKLYSGSCNRSSLRLHHLPSLCWPIPEQSFINSLPVYLIPVLESMVPSLNSKFQCHHQHLLFLPILLYVYLFFHETNQF